MAATPHQRRNAAIQRKIEAYAKRVTSSREAALAAIKEESRYKARHPQDLDRGPPDMAALRMTRWPR